MDEGGANLTPDKLPRAARDALFARCDQALAELITLLAPRALVGVGNFAAKRLAEVLDSHGTDIAPRPPVHTVLHPSPASPRANQNWEGEVLAVLEPTGLWP
jgi:single-strand selective monofunctional uracil DNA glycosylase